jgi:hypothetical protein
MWSLVIATFLALVSAGPHAQWSLDGRPMPDAPNRKWRGGFGANLLVISHPSEFVKQWAAAPSDHVLEVPEVSTAKRGDRLAIVVFFAGCKTDESGRCNAVYDLTILRPDGSTMHGFQDLELWKQQAPANTSHVQLGAAIPQITFEGTDPPGTYRIRVVVRDDNRDVTLELETTLNVE